MKISAVGILKPNHARRNSFTVWVRSDFGAGVMRLIESVWQRENERQTLIEFDIDLTPRARHRSLEQNRLLWALIAIIVNEHNGGRQYGNDLVSKDDIYQALLQEYAPRKKTVVAGKMVEHHVGTSQLNTKQMAEFLDRVFSEIATMEIRVGSVEEIGRYWRDWRQMLNDKKIKLHEEQPISGAEYKKLTPICEATGQLIQYGGGSLAHIKARGMGGNPEDWKDYPSNWLHLCDTAHAEWDNGQGRAVFLKKYPWLKYKIETALLRDYSVDELRDANQHKLFDEDEIKAQEVTEWE